MMKLRAGRTGPALAAGLALALLLGGCTADDATGGGGTVPTEAQKFSYTTHDVMVPVVDGPADDHEVTIDSRLYLPENATPQTPQPAIIVTHGFGNNKLSTEVVSTADFFARNGYVVLTYSSQGFGQSSGCIRLNSFDYDVKDSIGLMDRVFDDPDFRVNGITVSERVQRDEKGARVGLIGGSYGGSITLNVAATDSRVRAIVPGRTWNALEYGLMPNNRIPPGAATELEHQADQQGVFKLEWTTLLFSLGNAQPAMGNGGCPEEKLASGEADQVAGLACTGFPLALCQTYANIASTGEATAADFALVRGSSISDRIEQLRTPTMLVQGQSDTIFNLNDATANYLALKQAGVPVAMIWNWGGHGAYYSQPGECEVYGGDVPIVPDGCYLPTRALRWFDRWLRQDAGVDNGPEFAWFQDWLPYDDSGSAASQYGQAPEYPAQPSRRFYLSGSGDLVDAGAEVAAGSVTIINPAGGEPASYTETSNFTSPDASPSFSALPPSDPPGQAVSFTSAPFGQAVESVGIPRARLHLSHLNGQDLVFFGKVFDVAPDGSAELIHRLIAPVRVPAAEVGLPVDFHLLGFAHRFAAGHRVRLTIASTDQTSYNAKLPDTITLVTGGEDPAYFELPVSD